MQYILYSYTYIYCIFRQISPYNVTFSFLWIRKIKAYFYKETDIKQHIINQTKKHKNK